MSNEYLKKYFPFLGQFIVISLICENLVTQLIKGHRQSIEEISDNGFEYKVRVFTEHYNKKYKRGFEKKHPGVDIIKELTVLRDLRNAFTHGAPLINGGRLLLAKVSDTILEGGENAEIIIGDFSIDDFPIMIKSANNIIKLLIGILEQEGRIPVQNLQ